MASTAWLAKLASGGAAAMLLLAPPVSSAEEKPSAEEKQATQDDPVVLVQPHRRLHPMSSLLNGVNNNEWFGDSHGLWDPEKQQVNPDVVAKARRAGLHLVRYPGGTSANLFDWKRAIGPQDQRGCQRDGRPEGGPLDSRYGPDEHMQFVAQAGAQAQIMVSFASESPADAADWVEYMNAPVGTNPNGGIAWADVRAANGHPEPYGVKYWEIGNEHDRNGNQRYWLNREDVDVAMRQYVFGGTQRQYHTDIGQQVGKGCDFRVAVASDGTPGQVFNVRFPPVVPGSAVVYVGGDVWQEVDDLSSAGPDDEVYELRPESGEIVFGDGVHGKVPPAGADVEADYDSGPHPGFLDFYRAMKSADPSIDVCAIWGEPSFPKLMADTGHADEYDCLTVHPYTNFSRDFGNTLESAQQGHDWHMLGEATQTKRVADVIAAVRRYASPGTYVTVSEYGALFFGSHDADVYPSWNTAMSHVTYMASQWTRFANVGMPWAEGNTLISSAPSGLRAVLGGPPVYVFTAEATAREALRPMFDGGGYVVANRVLENPTEATEPTNFGSSYPALASTATVDRDGRLLIAVVNRDSTDPVTARVVPAGYRHDGTVAVSTVAGEHFTSFNSIEHPNDVVIDRAELQVGGGSFAYTFPPASVTLLQLTPAG
ncbi:MAG TPA: hypothetical protein VIL34_10445 [Actinopolymorphaceae bacterium]|jgi:alpha-N-arabinofuranosidase